MYGLNFYERSDKRVVRSKHDSLVVFEITSPLQSLADYHALSRAKARLHTPCHGGKSIAAISSLYPFMTDILAALQGLKLIQQKEVISLPQTVRICRQLYSQHFSNWQKFKLAN